MAELAHDTMIVQHPDGLKQLESMVRRDLEYMQYPGRDWMPKRTTSSGAAILDVLIVGGGQSGLVTAFGLMQEKINNILVVDENPEGKEGPWLTFARMKTLRTPKYLTGPDLGYPNLTIRMWYEAQYGDGSWEKLGLVPKEMWAEYLYWYRRILKLPVQNSTKVGSLEWLEEEQCFKAPIETNGQHRILYAHKVVLATGIDGSGRWMAPKFVTENVADHLYSHTRGDIDFAALKGKKIAVLGAGASAFDNASVALENGVGKVDLIFRRQSLVDKNAYRWAEFTGFLKHHSDLDDESKWKFMSKVFEMGQLPPIDTLRRAEKHPNFEMHPGTEIESVTSTDSKVMLETNKGTKEYDFLITATGFVTDLSLRPTLQNFHDKILLWKHQYSPPDGPYNNCLLSHPYLGDSFQFMERDKGSAPYLSSIYNYNFGCVLSMGFGGASISGMKYSVPRLVGGITSSFYKENSEYFFETLENYDIKEF